MSVGVLFGATACTKKNIVSLSVESVPGSEEFVRPSMTGIEFALSGGVILESSEPVRLSLPFDSSTKMLAMSITSEARLAEVTIRGLSPDETYYKYEDDYHKGEVFMTDPAGDFTYVQDLSMPRLVFIQDVPGTSFIKDDVAGGDCQSIGYWDVGTKTCTLTGDVNGSIQVDANNVTLDGGGHTLSGGGSGTGVYLYMRTGVTIRHLNVTNFTTGVQLYLSSNNTLENITASSNTENGILLYSSGLNALSGNTANSNKIGMYLYFSAMNTLTGNTAFQNADYGIVLYSSADNELQANNGSVASFAPQATEPSAGPPAPALPGRLEVVGTHFEVSGSGVLNLTLDSTHPVKLSFESAPDKVVMHVETASTAASTVMSITGLAPETTYHMYEDDFHNHTPFTTDVAGSYTYVQDLLMPHLVFIQTRKGTKYLSDNATGGDCTSIGSWDAGSRTCTFTTDVNEMIQIDSDNIIIDGNGYTVSSGSWTGVYLPRRTGVTVRNLTLTGLSSGIYLFSSSGNTLENNTVSSNSYGIYLFSSSGNTISNNILSSNKVGIFLYGFGGNTISNNIDDSNAIGIYIHSSSGNTVTGNTANSNNIGIFLASNSEGNTVTGNTASSNVIWIYLVYSNGNVISKNTVDSNAIGAILWDSSNNQSYNNNFINNTTQLLVYDGSGNIFNLPMPTGGNYWSDFDTPGEGCDNLNAAGLCDSPYHFASGRDNHPWIAQDRWLDRDGDGVSEEADICPDEDATGFDVDGDGCIDSFSGLVSLVDTHITEGAISDQLGNSIVSMLENIEKSINKDNICATVNQLEAFKNEINAQRGRKVSDEAADEIVVYTDSLISYLLSKLPEGNSCR